MIKPLRKRHLQTWLLLAILLPIGIISATVARRHLPHMNLVQPQSGVILPLIVKQKETPRFSVQLRSNNTSQATQLLWINKQPLITPTAAIYMASSDQTSLRDAHYIGRIEWRGIYVFNLTAFKPQAPIHFIVYDFIHRKIVEKVVL